MGSNAEPFPPKPWVRTPLIRSTALSRIAGCNIHLKLENLQPSGSFKSRGVGNFLLSSLSPNNASNSPKTPHFYCSSGGNAGLACVVAATSLGLQATIVVPLSTSPLMITKLLALGATVIQNGPDWSSADHYLRTILLSKDPNGVYVPPFDHPEIWSGNSTLIDELEQQLPSGYDCVVCSVGGGGLFAGIMEGLDRFGRLSGGGGRGRDVKVLAVETKGADSLNNSLKQKKLSKLDGITSIATSLGATQPCQKAFEWGMREEVESIVLQDAEAAMACVRFADDERTVVESACGVSLATVYNGTLRKLYKGLSDEEFKELDVVIVVCGGSNVTLEVLEGYKVRYGEEECVKRFGGKKVVGKVESMEGVTAVV